MSPRSCGTTLSISSPTSPCRRPRGAPGPRESAKTGGLRIIQVFPLLSGSHRADTGTFCCARDGLAPANTVPTEPATKIHRNHTYYRHPSFPIFDHRYHKLGPKPFTVRNEEASERISGHRHTDHVYAGGPRTRSEVFLPYQLCRQDDPNASWHLAVMAFLANDRFCADRVLASPGLGVKLSNDSSLPALYTPRGRGTLSA